MANTKLYNVIGLADLEGTVFASCTTYEKATKAKKMLESAGLKNFIDVVQDELPVDVIEINGEIIEL